MLPIKGEALPRYFYQLREYLAGKNITAYLVGGVVRDLLQGRKVQDIDLAVDGDVFELSRKLANEFKGYFVPLDKEHGVCRIVLPQKDFFFDLAQLRGDILADLGQRDFTIDALAVKLDLEALIDPYGGEEDLRQRKLRAVASGIFQADPLRLLRAIRLCAELGFELETQTEKLILKHRGLISSVSGERLREELLKILSQKNSYPYVLLMERTGLMEELFPELKDARGVTQPPEHFGDVFVHSLETVKSVEFVLAQGEGWGDEVLSAIPWSEELAKYFASPVSGFPRSALIKLAGLLHDIAKPRCRAYDEKGKLRFFGHTEQGAKMAGEILTRLRFSSREISLIQTLIKYHLRPTQLSQEGELPTRRAVYRFFRDSGDAGIDILFLSLADHLAARGPGLELSAFKEHCRLIAFILEEHKRQLEETKPPKLIDGHEIMKHFSLSPGPLIGRLLETVKEAQASGEIKTKEEALELLRKKLAEEYPTSQVAG